MKEKKHITNEKKLTWDNDHNCYIFEVKKNPIVISTETDNRELFAFSESYLFNVRFPNKIIETFFSLQMTPVLG